LIKGEAKDKIGLEINLLGQGRKDYRCADIIPDGPCRAAAKMGREKNT
jgi:hypothetical protein